MCRHTLEFSRRQALWSFCLFLVASVPLIAPGQSLWAQCVNHEHLKLLPSDGAAGNRFGSSLAMSDDVAVVGSPLDDENGFNSGSAYVYRYDGLSWGEEQKLLAPDGRNADTFGNSVAVEGDLALIGVPKDDDQGFNAGAAWIYRFSGAIWVEEQKLLPLDGESLDAFGLSAAISGDAVILGAAGDDDNGADAGAAYVYRFNPETSRWEEEQKLLASDGSVEDYFGIAVALSGDVAVVGAYFSDHNGPDGGAAHVFRFDGKRWEEEQLLLASDGGTGDLFGIAVAIDHDRVLIGAPGNEGVGALYEYRFNGSTWEEEQKLLASDAEPGDGFGISVAVKDHIAVIGAVWDDDNGFSSGSAYLYRFNLETRGWVEEQKLLASDGATFDEFGRSVALNGVDVLIAATSDDDHGEDSGSVYVFELDRLCETICPDDPDDFKRVIGGPATGDALRLCESDDVRLEVEGQIPATPLLPFLRLEYWAHTTLGDGAISQLDFDVECHVSAIAPGGQRPDTLRTSVRNFAVGQYEIKDQRATPPNEDVLIEFTIDANASDYVNPSDGEIRVRQDAWNPGNYVLLFWSLKVDQYEVTVTP